MTLSVSAQSLPPEIYSVPVRQSAYDSDDPTVLIDALIDVAKHLQAFGMYELEEMPVVLRHTLAVSQYVNQVLNGGHEQYVANVGRTQSVIALVDEGLGAIGAHDHQRVFRETMEYIHVTEERAIAVRARGGFDHPVHGKVDDWIGAKDSEFYALDRTADTFELLKAWLKQQPSVRPTKDLQWKFEMAGIIEGNPLRDARIVESGQSKRDFLAELVASAPMKKSYYTYADEIAKRHGMTLPLFQRGRWEGEYEGRKCTMASYEIQGKDYLVLLSKTDVTMLQTKRKLFGKGSKVVKNLGTVRVEYQEV